MVQKETRTNNPGQGKGIGLQMSNKDGYDPKECENKRQRIYEKFDDHTEKLGQIHGGVKVLVVMLPTVGALIMIILGIVGWTAKDQISQLREMQHHRMTGEPDASEDKDEAGPDVVSGGFMEDSFYMDRVDTRDEKGAVDDIRGGETKALNRIGGEERSE